jgi:hypothetical protein
MSARIFLPIVLLPLISLAQQAPPPEVDQALRARVTEFLQYHVDGNFRKAYEMVAEDTKDQYFTMGKSQLKGFKIEDVKFSDNFTKATVLTTMSKTVNVAGTDMPVTMPSAITWKIENGKWVWFSDAQPPSMLPGVASALGTAPAQGKGDDGAGLPKDFSDQSIAAAARSILQQVSVDRKEVILAADKTSEDKVVFHNGMPGSVQLELSAPEIPGFTAKLEQSTVRGTQDMPVVFRYEPGGQAEPRDPFNVQLWVQPLNQLFVIRVNFAASSPVVVK